MALYIGLMSGTSLDGVDAVLVETDEAAPGAVATTARQAGAPARERAFAHLPFDGVLRAECIALNRSGNDELHRAALVANAVSRVYAQVIVRLLEAGAVAASEVTALGAHGQTVRHRPGEFDGNGYSLQLLNGALLAELCGIDVICDFRNRDLAAGGQGAPLVPAFHAARFARAGESVAVLNLGGIANLTLLRAAGPSHEVVGFDCGPGNMLLDLWCQRRRQARFDDGGAWAGSGQVDTALLEAGLRDPFFARQPPKSTGRDLFDDAWLDRWLACARRPLRDEDVAATLAELTVHGAIDALRNLAPDTRRLLVCGGGAHNGHLMRRLQAGAGQAVVVESTAAAGVAPDRVEALAFAWLAQAFTERRTGNLRSVTGASGARVLGALYPAGTGSA
jgi:anhydro-N-acetylmuramic acid kinase